MTPTQPASASTVPNPAMQKADFISESNEHVQIGRIWKRVAHLDGLDATLVTFPKDSSVTEDAVKTGYLGDLRSAHSPTSATC